LRVSIVDRLEIGDREETPDGYLAVNAKIARIGHYQYLRSEIGDTEGNPNELVDVYRSEDEVFDADAMASFAHKPITLNHPQDAVGKKNWRQYSRGMSGGRVVRSGDFLEIPMVVNDGDAIAAIEAGTRELSAGYSADIIIGDGVAPDGKPYRAVMQNIRGNHIAIVAQGRAGSQCRIGDAAWPVEDTTPNTPPKKDTARVKTFNLDGLPVRYDDEAALDAAFAKLTDAIAKAETALATAITDKASAEAAVATAATANVTAIEAKDAAVATLEATVATLTAELADARDPAKLRDAAAAYAATCDKAKALGATIADNASEADVKKAAVAVKLGDIAANWTDAQIDVSFATLTAGVKDAAPKPETDAFRDAMANRTVVDFADATAKAVAARKAMIDGFNAPRDAAK